MLNFSTGRVMSIMPSSSSFAHKGCPLGPGLDWRVKPGVPSGLPACVYQP